MIVMDQHQCEMKHLEDARWSHQGQNTEIALETQIIPTENEKNK